MDEKILIWGKSKNIFPKSYHNAWTKKPNPTWNKSNSTSLPHPQTTSGHLPEKGHTPKHQRDQFSFFLYPPVTPQSPTTLMAQLGDVPMKDFTSPLMNSRLLLFYLPPPPPFIWKRGVYRPPFLLLSHY